MEDPAFLGPPDQPNDPLNPGWWHELIDENPAAEYLHVAPRKMQNWRQKGGGPPYIRISARCIRYTRAMLWKYAMDRIRNSTSDPGPDAR